MASGYCERLGDLPASARAIIEGARRAALATIGDDGRPHLVPVCFAIVGDEILSAVDQKPKSGRELARLRNVRERASATLLFDRWDEDWTRLGWVMVAGAARISPPGSGVSELSARYEQYGERPPLGEVLVVRPDSIRWWMWS